MTNLRTYAPIVSVIFIATAVFGLYLPLAGMSGHDMGCPFSVDGTSVCAQPLAHVAHWQSAFAATLVEILVLIALMFIARSFSDLLRYDDTERERCRLRISMPVRSTLFQELFAKGILNRKAP